MIHDVTVKYFSRREKWNWDFKAPLEEDGKLKKVFTGEHDYPTASVTMLGQPFGFSIIVSNFDGENHIHWLASGGHGSNHVVISHRVDSKIEVFEFNHVWPNEPKEDVTKRGQDAETKFLELLGEDDFRIQTLKILRLLGFKFATLGDA